MLQQTLVERVLDELRLLRRQSSGVTVETLALAPAIRGLLGNGDPFVTYARLQQGLMDATADRTLRAAAASLGFSAAGDTHLKRLDDAGYELGLEQRQVRRLSDIGLVALATLISTNWTVEAVPELIVIVTGSPGKHLLGLSTVKPALIEMSKPRIDVIVEDDRRTWDVSWRSREDGQVERAVPVEPLVVESTTSETSVVFVWRGEMWPKFTIHWAGGLADVTSESLGNKLMLRLVRHSSRGGD